MKRGKFIKTSQRKIQLEHGFFDGRFVSRFEESKKKYTRKQKHKKDYE